MRLVRLIYASRLNDNVDTSDLAKIYEKAVKNNTGRNITGILVFGNDRFLQYLEGGREQVNAVYSKISRDPRHKDNLIIDYAEISERVFDQWAMKNVLITKANIHSMLKYTTKGEFDPFEMSAQSALAYLISLAHK